MDPDDLCWDTEWCYSPVRIWQILERVACPSGIVCDWNHLVWSLHMDSKTSFATIIIPALAVGLVWLGLTIAFEFLFWHYVAKHPLNRLIHDYNILEGRLWSFVLIVVAIAPYVFYKIGPFESVSVKAWLTNNR